MGPDRLLPADLVERARAYEAAGDPPVVPRWAATIALLRDGPSGFETYLLRRVPTMAFASGMHVFPGGTVDPRDLEPEGACGTVGAEPPRHADVEGVERPLIPEWVGPPPEIWADRLGVSVELAQGLVYAAIRETFEESGVLLAGRGPDDVVDDVGTDDWERDRLALLDRSLAFTEMLQRRALVVRTDLVRAWARWVTPEFEPRRYDTAFFVAALPASQQTRDVAGEADRVAWVRPSSALEALASKSIAMLPPTAVVLGEIASFRTVAEVLAGAERRTITSTMPRPVLDVAQPYVVLPGERGYDR